MLAGDLAIDQGRYESIKEQITTHKKYTSAGGHKNYPISKVEKITARTLSQFFHSFNLKSYEIILSMLKGNITLSIKPCNNKNMVNRFSLN